MAFIELTPEELSMLSEQEREQYEKELRLHQERAAFVEQLEKIENADFRYEKPKFRKIKPVRRLDIPEYKRAAEVQVELSADIVGAGRDIAKKGAAVPSGKISAALSGTKAAVSGVPAVKVELPQTNVQPVTERPSVSGIAPVKPGVPAPHVEPAEISGIAGLPTIGRIDVPEVGFEFDPEPVTVEAVKVQLPELSETSGIGAAEIKNIPAAAKIAVPQAEFKPVAATIGENIAELAGAKITPPLAHFQPITAAVSVTAPKPVCDINTSEIDDRIALLKDLSANTVTFTAEKPNIPDISVSAAPQFEASVPVVSCITPDVPAFIRAERHDVQTPTVTVPQPSAASFDCPEIKPAEGVNTFKTTAPECTYIEPDTGAKDIPDVTVNIPAFTDDEVSKVLGTVMRKLQGA